MARIGMFRRLHPGPSSRGPSTPCQTARCGICSRCRHRRRTPAMPHHAARSPRPVQPVACRDAQVVRTGRWGWGKAQGAVGSNGRPRHTPRQGGAGSMVAGYTDSQNQPRVARAADSSVRRAYISGRGASRGPRLLSTTLFPIDRTMAHRSRGRCAMNSSPSSTPLAAIHGSSRSLFHPHYEYMC